MVEGCDDNCEKEELSSKLTVGSEKALIFPQVRAALTASLGGLLCGNVNGWTGTALTKMKNDFEMNATQFSLVAALISYGALVGSLISGKTMDIFGRKRVMVLTTPLMAISWILIGTAPNIYVVYVGRFFCGVSTGFLLNAANVYTSETCQANLRGRLGSVSSVTLTSGILVSYVMGGFFPWRISSFLALVPVAIFLINLLLIPESPYWYLLTGNYNDAYLSLERLRGPKFAVANELTEMSRKIPTTRKRTGYSELLKRRTFIPLLIALLVQTMQQICGGNVVVAYSSAIFENANSSVDPQIATVYTGVAQVVGNIVSIFLIDRYGRRFLLATSVGLCGAFMAIFGGYFLSLRGPNPWLAWSPLVIIIGFMFSYCLGCRGIPWLIGSELFSTSIRSQANSITVFYNRALNIIIVQIFPYTTSSLGEAAVFLAYGFCCIMCLAGTLIFVPETKGRTLEDIQDYFESKQPRRLKKITSKIQNDNILPPESLLPMNTVTNSPRIV